MMNKVNFIELLNKLGITDESICEISKETGLIVRQREILPQDLLAAICTGSVVDTLSHNDTAARIAASGGAAVSKVAIFNKVNEKCKSFFEAILGQVILGKICPDSYDPDNNHQTQYLRVIVQDSTIIRLPSWLFEIFSGVSNGDSKFCNARIQCSLDLLTGKFLSFSIDPYSKNDLKAAPETPLQKGDMTLRDRGYLTYDEVQRHIDIGAHCIYRYKNKMGLLDPITGQHLDLLTILEKQGNLDITVVLNNKERTPVRLLAKPVAEEIANNRRMNAKKEYKRPLTKEYLKMLSWSIFITTVPESQASYREILETYGLRWRVEIIFKCWKSNLAFNKIHRVSANQLSVLLLARFIMITIYIQHLFEPCRKLIKVNLNKDLSLIKFIRYLIVHPHDILALCLNIKMKICSKPIDMIAKYCSYEKRKRRNFYQHLEQVCY